ncbi:hypothetical protein C7212DRAFT_352789 [Tuber magnatum]|uniref:Uncharacterized protein n=1 Tax=Tuber magnatum TaxID=42249 RepID=A0A317SL39_9PEZI|nr:hypothetical protein C7212DRAFT_352789 [Tuber magnatum]
MRWNSLLFSCLLLALLATTALSQEDSKTENPPASTNKPAETSKPPDPTTTKETPKETSKEPSTKESDKQTSDAVEPPPSVRITASGTSEVEATGTFPTISTGFPSVTRGFAPVTPTVTVPPTANAPFMQKSSLPEGTVFIAVGSALGLFALSVILWRCLVAWSLHRSVKRAAMNANISDTKALIRPPPNGGGGAFYAGGGPGSTLSFDHLGAPPRPGTNPNRQPNPASGLFFSPTAGTGNAASDRRSQYLPSGYYAAGARDNTVGLGGHPNSSHTHLATHSVSSTRYNPNRGMGISPPSSPLIGPTGPATRGGSSHGGGQQLGGLRCSESHTSLNLPSSARAPSAYLEDLFENHRQQNPGNNGRY